MPDSTLPRASLCLLTYKRAGILRRTLDSLLAQTHRDFELIVNDDCSPDDTEQICLDYARRDSRVRYCRNPRNLRYAGNQNAAVLRASTDYVGIVHDGDVYRNDMLAKWLSAMVRHPTAALVFNAVEKLDHDGRVVGIYRHPYAELTSGHALLDEMLVELASPIFGIVMIRRAAAIEAGPFDPRLPVLADVDMWMRLLMRHDAAYVAEPLYAAAPREVGHHNSFRNWRVREEHELIHALNLRRRYYDGVSAPEAKATASRLTRALVRSRLVHLAACARHVEARAFLDGLAYIRRRPWPLDLMGTPDSVTDWTEVEASLRRG